VPPPSKAPEFKAPDVKLDIPDFKAPDFKVPDFKVPDFKAPDVKIPSFSMPKIDVPSMPTTSGAPALSVPKFDFPKGTSISMPNLDLRTEVEEDIEPQEIRDERAKEARAVYREAEEKAKVSALNVGGPLEVTKQFLISTYLFLLFDRIWKPELLPSGKPQTKRRRLLENLRTTRVRQGSAERFSAFVLSTRDTKGGRLGIGLIVAVSTGVDYAMKFIDIGTW
jgi:hypothetical protein